MEAKRYPVKSRVFFAFMFVILSLAPFGKSWGQTTIFTETMGNVSSTTTIAAHEAANGFDNDSYTMTSGGATNPGDIRATSASSGYTGASGSANVWLTSTNAAYGFAIEGIDASSFTSLTIQFGYRKESGSALPTLALDYWNGSSYVNIPFTFNEAASVAVGWYLSPTVSLPTGAQISNLKLRWVKTGSVAVRIDDVILKGTGGSVAPTVTTQTATSITTTTATGNGNITATGGVNPTVRGFCWDLATNPDPDINDSKVQESGSFGTGAFTGNITGLSAGTQYKVRAYATNTVGTSYGNVETFTTQVFPEPSNFPTSFVATANSSSQITATWVDASSGQLPAGYLVKAAIDPSVPAAPSDGTAESDATLVKNITQGTQQAIFAGLQAGTKYNFAIWPYTNSGTNINYKLGTQPTATATTISASSDVVAVTSSESATISSLIVDAAPLSATTGIQVWQFTIRDGGGSNDADALPTIVTGITLAQDAGNAINDWAKAIRTISLFDGTSNVATATVSSNQIVFSGMNLNIPDNGSKTYSLRLSLNSPLNSPEVGNNDGDDFVFSLAEGNFATKTDGTSSLKGTFGAAVSNNDSNVLSIVATKIAFLQQPTTTEINATMNPDVTVRSTDIYNNIDRDYSTDVTIISEGDMTNEPITHSPVQGIATFSSIIHTALATGIHLSATTGSFSSITSDAFNITTINFIDGDYRTTGSGVWISNSASPAIWQRYNGSSWASSNSPAFNSSNTIYIADGNTITTTESVGNSAKLVIMSNGTFNNNHPCTYALIKVMADGNLNINGSLSISGSGSLEVEDNANMTINFAYGTPSSSIWNGTEIFHPSSNLILTDWDCANDVLLPSNTAIIPNTYNGYTAAFGNIIFDFNSNIGSSDDLIILESGININLAHGDLIFRTNAVAGADFRLSTTGTVTSGIGGDFIVEDSYIGSNNINLKSSGTLNFSINGDWLQDAGNVRVTTSSTDGSSSTNILGNMVLTPSSSLDFNSTVTSNNITSTINLNGDLSAAGSALFQNSNSSRNGILNFSGTGDGTAPDKTQTIDIASTSSNENRYINFNVKNGAFVELANRNLELGTNSKLTVESGGTLNFGFTGTTPLNLTNSGAMSGVNFELQSGGNLIITSIDGISSSGTTSGNVRNSGSHTFSTAGNYTYTGTTAQTTGTGLPATVNNLIIDNSGGVSLTNTAVTTTNNLTINTGKLFNIDPGKQVTVNGTLTNNGGTSGLIIKSDATGTGSLIHSTTNVDATIQRYITGSTSLTAMMYHMVSIPLDPAVSYLSGLFYRSYLFQFTEADNDWYAWGSPVDNTIYANRGFAIYFSHGSDTTYSFPGKINSSAFTALTSYTDAADRVLNDEGWNLVPNPYPSSIDWDASSGWTKTNIDNSVYIWDAANARYASFVGGTETNGGSRYIQTGQGFFVHATATPTFTMNNSVRVHNGVQYFKNDEVIPNELRLELVAGFNKRDEMVVKFNEFASAGFDSDWDAYNLSGNYDVPDISTLLDNGVKLSINTLPFAVEDRIIPVRISNHKAEQLQISASGMETFNMLPPIYLEDKLLNNTIDLAEQRVYSFSFIPGQEDRFNLIFRNITSVEEPNELNVVVYKDNDKIRVMIPVLENRQATIMLFDALGRNLQTEKATIAGTTTLRAPETAGTYIVRIISGNTVVSRKIVIL